MSQSKIKVPSALLSSGGGVTLESRQVDNGSGAEKGSKIDRYDLIPTKPLQEVARLYGVGANKYAERNWEKGYDWSLSYGALQRHANQFWSGEDFDEETGLSHMAAVVFHAFALMEFTMTNRERDNRPVCTNSTRDGMFITQSPDKEGTT